MNPQDIITNYGREVEDASYNIYQALADELNNNSNYRKHFRLQLQSIENKNQAIKDFLSQEARSSDNNEDGAAEVRGNIGEQFQITEDFLKTIFLSSSDILNIEYITQITGISIAICNMSEQGESIINTSYFEKSRAEARLQINQDNIAKNAIALFVFENGDHLVSKIPVKQHKAKKRTSVLKTEDNVDDFSKPNDEQNVPENYEISVVLEGFHQGEDIDFSVDKYREDFVERFSNIAKSQTISQYSDNREKVHFKAISGEPIVTQEKLANGKFKFIDIHKFFTIILKHKDGIGFDIKAFDSEGKLVNHKCQGAQANSRLDNDWLNTQMASLQSKDTDTIVKTADDSASQSEGDTLNSDNIDSTPCIDHLLAERSSQNSPGGREL